MLRHDISRRKVGLGVTEATSNFTLCEFLTTVLEDQRPVSKFLAVDLPI